MGDESELSLPVRVFLKTYRWRRIDPIPWTPLKQPLAESKVGLVSSAGFVKAGDPPFDPSIRGGDWSFREIPETTSASELREFQKSKSFDHHGIEADSNLALPLGPLHQLARERRIGSLNPRALSFMGSITAPGRLIQESAPAAARLFVEDQVRAALLVPV